MTATTCISYAFTKKKNRRYVTGISESSDTQTHKHSNLQIYDRNNVQHR